MARERLPEIPAQVFEAPETPAESPLRWRAIVAKRSDAWRERWGIRANELEAQGKAWREAEQQAFEEMT